MNILRQMFADDQRGAGHSHGDENGYCIMEHAYALNHSHCQCTDMTALLRTRNGIDRLGKARLCYLGLNPMRKKS